MWLKSEEGIWNQISIFINKMIYSWLYLNNKIYKLWLEIVLKIKFQARAVGIRGKNAVH